MVKTKFDMHVLHVIFVFNFFCQKLTALNVIGGKYNIMVLLKLFTSSMIDLNGNLI